jgi:hypothetical protein
MSEDGILDINKGFFYAHKPNSKIHELAGQARILVLDFEVICKLLTILAKNLELAPNIDQQIKPNLESIQSQLLFVKSLIKNQSDNQNNMTEALKTDIHEKLDNVSSVVTTVSEALQMAINANTENKQITQLLTDAKESINSNLLLLTKEVNKYLKDITKSQSSPKFRP